VISQLSSCSTRPLALQHIRRTANVMRVNLQIGSDLRCRRPKKSGRGNGRGPAPSGNDSGGTSACKKARTTLFASVFDYLMEGRFERAEPALRSGLSQRSGFRPFTRFCWLSPVIRRKILRNAPSSWYPRAGHTALLHMEQCRRALRVVILCEGFRYPVYLSNGAA
jgi:hypothetical protein